MRINEKPLEPWLIVCSDGTVQSAHCTCMAALSEGCSHIAAVLFALEHGSRISKEASVTNEPAYWLFPTPAKLAQPFQRIRDIDFRSVSKKRKLRQRILLRPRYLHLQLLGHHRHRSAALFAVLSTALPSAAVLSLTDVYGNNFVPNTVTGQLPRYLGPLYDSTLKCNTYDDVLLHCARVNVSVTDAQVKFVECETRQQASSPLWFNMRAGRVTASTFHAACHISLQKPSVSLLKRICTNTHFSSAATYYAIQHENNARKQYIAQSSCEHVNFSCKMCDLFLNTRYPMFGASPDGIIECEFCGLGCLEIKCPITLTRGKLNGWSYLTVGTIGGLQLKRSSQYFYQVQMQMLLTGRLFCDFVVWGPSVLHVERIFSDVAFIEHTTEIAILFHAKCATPELCVKYFTSK